MRVVIIGTSPLPIEIEQITTGPGIRTWQFAKSVVQAGHEVRLICLRNKSAYLLPPKDALTVKRLNDNLVYYNFDYEIFTDGKTVEELVSEFSPDAIAGVSSILPVATAVRFHDIAPVWADLFGDPLTEIQSKSNIYPTPASDVELFHVWKLYRWVLSKADKFSVVSAPQRFALIGQLGFCGRLNRHTAEYEFVHIIPCGIDPEEIDSVESTSATCSLRGKELPEDAFIIFWIGSYNTWTDIYTLVQGLEKAMSANPRIRYLSIGGGTPQYNEKVFQDFMRLVESSQYHLYFIIKGWVSNAEVTNLFKEADVGINIDRSVYEAELGSRNRVLHFLARGLPVVSTGKCEFVRELIQKGFVREFQVGDPHSLAEALLEMAEMDRDTRRQISSSARKYVLNAYSFATTMRPFLEWLDSRPKPAPDNIKRSSTNPFLNEIERILNEPAHPTTSSLFKHLYRKFLRR